MNKITLAVLASLLIQGSALAAPSVWGIPGGSRFKSVAAAMVERGCPMRLDVSAMGMGKLRETLFEGVFFDRPCTIRTEFEGDSLTVFQFFFVKKDDPTSQDVGDMLGNYSELSLKLRSKYGYERKVESHGGGETQVWSKDGVTITLSCDGRSATGHTTVLTYDFRGAKE